MDFSAAEWAVLTQHLEEGMDLDPVTQQSWLEGLSGLDPKLKNALVIMLDLNRQPDDSQLLKTLPKLGSDSASLGLEELPIGRIGPYDPVRELGVGGMGSVWLANRVDGALTRTVALKLPHAIGRKQFFERFQRERDILASFAHPNIAQIYDAGTTDAGRPYIALEYVDGKPVTTHCDSLGHGVKERLNLFFQVLSAVQYAHTRLVIHRDLKPSNILATQSGEVKLLDFGIAKLLNPEGEEALLDLTQTGERAMTLDYAAPEQFRGQRVGAAADIYSLGVVLFELLAGKRPYSLRDHAGEAAERALHSMNLPQPSEVAKQQSKKYWKSLKGDLDAIVLKALRLDPAERYPTADALAQDLHRFLDGEPVSAQPEKFGYRAGKFLRRNRLAVAAGAAVFLALAAGLAVALWQRNEARKSAQTAQAVQTFVTDMFSANSGDQPDPVKARSTTARELLDIGAKKLNGSLNGSPAAKVEVLATLAGMYYDLGLDDTAVKLARERLQLARSLNGNQSPKVAEVLVNLAEYMQSSSFATERPAVLQEALAILDHNGNSTSRLRAQALTVSAEEYVSKDLEKALGLAREAVAVSRKTSPIDLVNALFQNGVILSKLSRDPEAIPVLSEAIAVAKRIGWSDMLVKLYAFQADAQRGLLDLRNAEQGYRSAYQLARAHNGAEHIDTVQTEVRLGGFLADYGRNREGLQLMEDAYRVALKTRGREDAFHVPMIQEMYGSALARHGQLKDGMDLLRLAIANRRKNRPGTYYLAQMLEELATYEVDLGQYRQAEQDLGEASSIRNKAKAPAWVSDRVKLLLAEGKSQEAATVLEGHAPLDAMTIVSLQDRGDRARVYLAVGNPEAALRIASSARAQVAGHPDHEALVSWEESFAESEAEADLALGRIAPARELFDELIRKRSAQLDPNSPNIVESRLGAAVAAHNLGRSDERKQLCAAAKAVIFGVPLGEHYKKRFESVCGGGRL